MAGQLADQLRDKGNKRHPHPCKSSWRKQAEEALGPVAQAAIRALQEQESEIG